MSSHGAREDLGGSKPLPAFPDLQFYGWSASKTWPAETHSFVIFTGQEPLQQTNKHLWPEYWGSMEGNLLAGGLATLPPRALPSSTLP